MGVEKIFSFGSWDTDHPADRHPGERIDAQFDAHANAIRALEARIDAIVRADGKLHAEVIPIFSPRQIVAPKSGFSHPGSTNVATLSDAAAENWAEVSMEWAEHMPDTIPGGILASNAITGDHWSSRWWANQAARLAGRGTVTVVKLKRFPFNGVAATFPLLDDATSAPIVPATNVSQLSIFINDVVQEPGVDFVLASGGTAVTFTPVPGNNVPNFGTYFLQGTTAASGTTVIGATLFATRVLAAAAILPGDVIAIATGGYTTAGDGGGARYYRVGGSTFGGFQSVDGAWWALEKGDLNVRQFGAVGNGVSDETAATQAAINAALAIGGGVVYFPRGTYTFARPAAVNGGVLNPGAGNIRFVGDGQDLSILRFDEGVDGASAKYLFKETNNSAKGFLSFEHLQFTGIRGADCGYVGGNPLQLNYYTDVRISECKFFNIASQAMDLHYLRTLQVVDSIFNSFGGCSIRCRDVSDVFVSRNHIERTGDDGISLHTYINSPADLPVRERIIVTDNIFINCAGRAVSALGAVKLTVANNIFHLCGMGIEISQDTSIEGQNPQHDILIENNLITDCFKDDNAGNLTPGYYIGLHVQRSRGATATHGAAPLRYDSTAGAIIRPWDWYQSFYSDTSYALPPAQGITVRGNVMRRTLPNVAAFSDYGYGTRNRNGITINQATTDTIFRVAQGILMTLSEFVDVTITDNIIEHTVNGIQFSATLTSHLDLKNLVIKNNTFFDCTAFGLLMPFSGTAYTASLIIDGNIFDMDFYRVATASNIDGTYDGGGLPSALGMGVINGFVVRNNTFANCASIVTFDQTLGVFENNIVRCGVPAVINGFSVSNKGVGLPLSAYGAFRLVIIDSDPTSGTYGALQNELLTTSAAMPTTGYYPAGWFVRNSSPTIAAGLLGWLRTTDGSAHVLNTNWTEIGERRGSATLDPTSLVDGAGVTLTITVTGAALGDFAYVAAPYSLQGITVNAYVSAADTVSVRIQNESTATVDLASGTWRARVIR